MISKCRALTGCWLISGLGELCRWHVSVIDTGALGGSSLSPCRTACEVCSERQDHDEPVAGAGQGEVSKLVSGRTAMPLLCDLNLAGRVRVVKAARMSRSRAVGVRIYLPRTTLLMVTCWLVNSLSTTCN